MQRSNLFLTLTLAAAVLGVARCENQSEGTLPGERPMESPENEAGQRSIETPQVVLQLKYDDGELNKIYLAQFRKDTKSSASTVPARTSLCSDLCHAGLGGESCGSSCPDLMPVGLQMALHNSSLADTEYGEPRVDVCPTLCAYDLGHPLCNCADPEHTMPVDWLAICSAFCSSDRYVLGGCPPCEEHTDPPQITELASKTLATAEGWAAWCNVQCRQGHGGAACNCDRSPFQ